MLFFTRDPCREVFGKTTAVWASKIDLFSRSSSFEQHK
jgi:hypothetical protein